MTGEVRGSWGGNPRSPCFSVTEGGHAMAVRRTMSFREALLNLSGTVPEGGRADGVERQLECSGLLLSAASLQERRASGHQRFLLSLSEWQSSRATGYDSGLALTSPTPCCWPRVCSQEPDQGVVLLAAANLETGRPRLCSLYFPSSHLISSSVSSSFVLSLKEGFTCKSTFQV